MICQNNRSTKNIYMENELSYIGTRPDVMNIESSGPAVGCLDHQNSEIKDNYDELQVALPIWKNARGIIKFTALNLIHAIVIITMCCGIYYIVVEDILSQKVDFGKAEMNSTSFLIQPTTAEITTLKIRALNKVLTVTTGYNNKGEWYAQKPATAGNTTPKFRALNKVLKVTNGYNNKGEWYAQKPATAGNTTPKFRALNKVLKVTNGYNNKGEWYAQKPATAGNTTPKFRALNKVLTITNGYNNKGEWYAQKPATAGKTTKKIRVLNKVVTVTNGYNTKGEWYAQKPATAGNTTPKIRVLNKVLTVTNGYNNKGEWYAQKPATAGNTTPKIRVLNKVLTVTNGYNNKGEWYAQKPATAGNTTPKIRVLNKVLTVTNGYNNKGEWYAYKPAVCDYGSYASGFQLKVEQDGGTWYDDSGVTDLKLHCSALNSEPTTSEHHAVKINVLSILSHGSSWTQTVKCKGNHYIVAFQLRTDANHWAMDKIGVANMDVMCRGPGLYGSEYEVIVGNGLAHWGDYEGFSEECNNGSAVCAFTLRYQQSILSIIIDRVGVTNVKLMCC